MLKMNKNQNLTGKIIYGIASVSYLCRVLFAD